MTTNGQRTLYAFDVDDTLEVSGGPVALGTLVELAGVNGIVGLCGNWALLCQRWPEWHHFVSFLGPMAMTKAVFLGQLREYVLAADYVMVGNAPMGDQAEAEWAGWRFIEARDFAGGVR